ncbi:hypothetical protein [Azospirillum picis]|uniref:Uncharacterized protein n=1 Tax=Azospirillum picis TaxID=488438 RepID=A0ABU0MTT7_9PROT|nr:hypothetical protein [Azospirillum picis]MBP2302817.1 hypothetical protein [Azospirillum picis]MDQ0536521.1 hypothetical protein [Azospirillum picis]
MIRSLVMSYDTEPFDVALTIVEMLPHLPPEKVWLYVATSREPQGFRIVAEEGSDPPPCSADAVLEVARQLTLGAADAATWLRQRGRPTPDMSDALPALRAWKPTGHQLMRTAVLMSERHT